jgi:hypothetical protein
MSTTIISDKGITTIGGVRFVDKNIGTITIDKPLTHITLGPLIDVDGKTWDIQAISGNQDCMNVSAKPYNSSDYDTSSFDIMRNGIHSSGGGGKPYEVVRRED